jgi:hypothetical protein
VRASPPRDPALEVGVERGVDDAHPAGAELALEAVAAQRAADLAAVVARRRRRRAEERRRRGRRVVTFARHRAGT